MILLAVGVALVSALHLAVALPSLTTRLKAVIGEAAYGPVFGLALLAALAIVVVGWRLADFVPLYDPPLWGAHANYLLTFIAFLCLGIFLFRGKLRQRLRFPMGLAAIFWATGHLLANGDLASLVQFGGFLSYAMMHIAIGARQGVRPSADIRTGHDLLSLLAGTALYGVMTQLHPVLIGVPIFTLTR